MSGKLLGLPAEIRCQIYEEVFPLGSVLSFCGHEDCAYMTPYCAAKGPAVKPGWATGTYILLDGLHYWNVTTSGLGLLFSHPQIYNEAKLAIFKNVTFSVDIHRVELWEQLISPTVLDTIGHLQINVECYDYHRTVMGRYRGVWVALSRMRGLKQVVVNLRYSILGDDPLNYLAIIRALVSEETDVRFIETHMSGDF